MKKYLLLFTLFLSFGLSFAQTKDSLSVEEQEKRKRNIEAGNPFKKFGYTPKIATLSKGKYLEWHDLDSIVRIGSYSFHVKKKDITGYNMDEDKNSESTLRPELTSRWLSPDPLAEEFPSWSPYNFVLNNPIRYIDPTGLAPVDFDDDITVNSKGIVTNVIKNDQPNRFFDENGKELFFNDPNNDFSLYNSWEKGDRLFHPISDKELAKANLDAGTRRTNKLVFYNIGLSYLLTAWDSHGKADFTMSHLVPNYFSQSEKSYLEEGVFRTSYNSYQHFFKFGDTNTIYNLYDAGNYMWGSWMRLNGYQSWEVKMGSQANELRKFGLDSDADQRAIINGYNHFNFLFDEK